MVARNQWVWVAVCLAISSSSVVHAEVRLLGVTGIRGVEDGEPSHTLLEINPDNASTTMIKQLSFIPDAHVIGFNPNDGLIYHFAGGEQWTDNPERIGGFRDHHYLETYNLKTGAITAIFNANGPPSPDDFPSFGLAAPRPSFILPEEQRLIDDPVPRERGEHEYHALRHVAWSQEEQLWYGSDELGLFTMTPTGESTFIGQPLVDSREMKGLAFYTTPAGEKQLLAGTRKNSNLWIVDPKIGDFIGDPVTLQAPPGSTAGGEFLGLVALAQHPETGVLYGVRNYGGDNDESLDRELVTINPSTGATALIGRLGVEMASIVFVPVEGLPGDYNGSGVLDAGDLDIQAQYIRDANLAGDLDSDGDVDLGDRSLWINTLQRSWVGDSNFDGQFDSGDFVAVFTIGKYEMGQSAGYAEGDWNGNGLFESGDFVYAFTEGGYEKGPRAAVAAVPEPGGACGLLTGLLLLVAPYIRRRFLT